MKFTELELKGAYLVELQEIADERGFFARSFCQREFEARGLKTQVVQCNVSFNLNKGTLRGMHFQVAPYEEAKLVRCTRGAIYDVLVDLRPDSQSYCKWTAVELNVENRRALYIPAGFAHGFQTLEADTEVFYQMFDYFAPECASGVRWDDPVFAISWPLPVSVISEKDCSYPDHRRVER